MHQPSGRWKEDKRDCEQITTGERGGLGEGLGHHVLWGLVTIAVLVSTTIYMVKTMGSRG